MKQIDQTLKILNLIDIKTGCQQTCSQILALSQSDGLIKHAIGAHLNTTKYVIWLAHCDQVVAAIFGRTKDDIHFLQGQASLLDDFPIDLWRIRANQNRVLVALGRRPLESVKQPISQTLTLLRKTACLERHVREEVLYKCLVIDFRGSIRPGKRVILIGEFCCQIGQKSLVQPGRFDIAVMSGQACFGFPRFRIARHNDQGGVRHFNLAFPHTERWCGA